MIICIDAGHGGHDAGAVYKNLIEKNINLKVARYLKEELIRHGIKVIMTRESDVFVDLTERANIANKNKCDYMISIHHNAGGGDRGEIIYPAKKESGLILANNIAKEFKEAGQTQVNTYYKTNSSGSDYFAVIRLAKCPSIITEYCFLDNENDNDIVDSEEKIKKEAIAIAKGLLKTIGIQYNQNNIENNKEEYELKNIVVYGNDIDRRAAEYLADYLKCPTINYKLLDGIDLNKVENIYAVGGTIENEIQRAKKIAGNDRYETIKKVLEFIGKI